MRSNKNIFPSLNTISGKISPFGSKVILRHDTYWSDPKLGWAIVEIRRIPCSCNSCRTILSLSWYSKTKEAFK